MEKIISESAIKDLVEEISSKLSEAVTEPGFDGQSGGTVTPGAEGDTNTTDIAQQARKEAFVKNSISQSLPYMMGYVQPLSGPVGFVFANKQKEDTSITHPNNPPNTVPDDPKDQIVTRKLVETEIREVLLDFTNEAIEDINRLFGDNFADYYDQYQRSGGEVWEGQNGEMANFFLELGQQRMTAKINKDYTDWLQLAATKKGQATIATYSEMANIYGIIGELRESLYKSTHKSGACWILVTPKIAAFLSSTVGSTMNNSAAVYNVGRRIASNKQNGYVMTMGDIDVYQYDKFHDVTGGDFGDSELTGEIFMGFTGGPGVSSVIYMPYKEYLVQGGGDYYTGQSSVFYRVRDAWCTNPLDTFDQSQIIPELDNRPAPPREANLSQYIMKVDITFGERLIN